MNPGNTSGPGGIVLIATGCIAVSYIITLTIGGWLHWPFVLLGVGVGLWAANVIAK